MIPARYEPGAAEDGGRPRGQGGSTSCGMVLDMNEAQVRTIEQMREVLSGTQAREFTVSAEDAGRYGWIEEWS